MSASFEKSVKGATKHKCAAPKAKYVEHILIATHAGEAGIAEVFRALNIRLRESVWTTVFKALIVVHYMIREGEAEVTLRYMKRNPRIVSLSHYSDAQIQGRNIRNYSFYLNERARTYGEVRTDYVRNGEGRLRKLSVDKGLLREVECLQAQIRALLACTFLDGDIDNEITMLAFRLLVSDLLVLFHVVNEGVINVLEHYFEMSRFDAERALEIYKVFTRQTDEVVEYLQQARMAETSTRLQIPNLQHAPTSLTSSLEEYLQDPDFEINRRQYLAQQQGKNEIGKAKPAAAAAAAPPKTQPAQNGPTPAAVQKETKIAPDLIDFFESIESDQAPMFAPQQQQQQMMPPQGIPMQYQQTGPNPFPGPVPQQQTGFQQQQQPFPQQQPIPQQQFQAQGQNPFPISPPIQPSFTGAGFGGYTPQDQPPTVSAPPMPAIPTAFMSPQQQQQQQPYPQQYPPPTATPQFQPSAPAPLQIPSQTGTNPFRASMLLHSASPQSSQPPAKSTNPFARPQTAGAGSVGAATTMPSPVGSLSATSAQRTGTNPFARGVSPQQTGGSALSVPGGTNPFRASIMMQQQQQGSVGGGVLDGVETMPVFGQQAGQRQWGQ